MTKIITIVTLLSLEATKVRNELGEKIDVKKGAEFTTTQWRADYYLKAYSSKFEFISSETVEKEETKESGIVWVGGKVFSKTDKKGIKAEEERVKKEEDEEKARNEVKDESKNKEETEEEKHARLEKEATDLGIELETLGEGEVRDFEALEKQIADVVKAAKAKEKEEKEKAKAAKQAKDKAAK